MGCFSWLDCVSGKAIKLGVRRTSYCLIPEEFGGGHYEQSCYGGYGMFGMHDAYDLIASWNREFISKNPNYKLENGKTVSSASWYKDYADLSKAPEQVSVPEWRYIGIELFFAKDYDKIPFPLKITYDQNAVYEDCKASEEDPMQGCD